MRWGVAGMHQISPMVWVPVWCCAENYHCMEKKLGMPGSGGPLTLKGFGRKRAASTVVATFVQVCWKFTLNFDLFETKSDCAALAGLGPTRHTTLVSNSELCLRRLPGTGIKGYGTVPGLKFLTHIYFFVYEGGALRHDVEVGLQSTALSTVMLSIHHVL